VLSANASNDRTVRSHLSADDVAAFVDGRLSADERSSVEAHLAVCADCRAEVVAISALVESIPGRARPRARWPIIGGVIAAAAAVLLFMMLPGTRDASRRTTRLEERSPSRATKGIEIISPSPAAQVARDSLRFTWRRNDSSSYRLFLTDSAGEQRYTTSTSDTTLVLPPTVGLMAGALYFWYVDGLRSDGTSVSSPPTAFSIRRP
jgi:hypothetical protein